MIRQFGRQGRNRGFATMSEPNSGYARPYSAQTQSQAQVDAGLRSYMLGIYNYMAMGLVVTGLVAFGLGEYMKANTEVRDLLFATPLRWVLMFAPLVFVLVLSFGINRLSASTAQLLFWAFAAVMGASISWIFVVFGMESIARTFFVTAASFGALSLYGYTTKTDLTAFGKFLFIGLVGLLLASLVNLFFPSGALNFVISVAGVFIFAGLTAVDTQKIKEMYYAEMDGESLAKLSIMGALTLYLDFINMFMFLLNFLGNREE
jgi:hypothetical protein